MKKKHQNQANERNSNLNDSLYTKSQYSNNRSPGKENNIQRSDDQVEYAKRYENEPLPFRIDLNKMREQHEFLTTKNENDRNSKTRKQAFGTVIEGDFDTFNNTPQNQIKVTFPLTNLPYVLV